MGTTINSAPLYFTASDSPCVPPNVTVDLQPWHVDGVRFLYRCFARNKPAGCILNHERDMNHPLQVSAFLSAFVDLLKQHRNVVICPFDSIPYWHYNLVNYGGATVVVPTEKNFVDVESGTVVLLSSDDSKLIHKIQSDEFYFVVIDEFDKVALKRYANRLSASFKIGLTSRNFYLNPDQKLLWCMLNWANKGSAGKSKDFVELDDDHNKHLRNPYVESWHRSTWSYYSVDNGPDLSVYDETVRNWSVQRNLTVVRSTDKAQLKKNKRTTSRKRTTNEQTTIVLQRTSSSSSDENFRVTPNKMLRTINVATVDGNLDDTTSDDANVMTTNETDANLLDESSDEYILNDLFNFSKTTTTISIGNKSTSIVNRSTAADSVRDCVENLNDVDIVSSMEEQEIEILNSLVRKRAVPVCDATQSPLTSLETNETVRNNTSDSANLSDTILTEFACNDDDDDDDDEEVDMAPLRLACSDSDDNDDEFLDNLLL